MRRRANLTAVWLLLGVLFVAKPAGAETRLDVGPQLLDGSTAYRIDIWGAAESLLDFSFSTQLVGLALSHRLAGPVVLEGGVWGRLSEGGGTLEDSDWLYFDAHPGLDVFSRSDLRVDSAFFGKAGIAATALATERLAVETLAGYAHQAMAFTASNALQVDYTTYNTIFLPGPVIAYSVTYRLPYVGLRTRLDPWLRLDVLYSPHVAATDRDDHLRREDMYQGRMTEGKLSEGSATGTAWMIEVAGVLPLERSGRATPPPPRSQAESRWSLVVALRHLSVQAQGEQRQWYYYADGTTAPVASDIPLTLSSQQTTLGAAIRLNF